jgi:hypothetical protein
METPSVLAQALVAPVFVALMVAVLGAALATSQLVDSALWKPKQSGLGWTVDFANPHAKYVAVFLAAWFGVLILGLSNPAAPGVSAVMHLVAQLIASA